MKFYEEKIHHLDRICNICHPNKLHILEGSLLIILIALSVQTLHSIPIQHSVIHADGTVKILVKTNEDDLVTEGQILIQTEPKSNEDHRD